MGYSSRYLDWKGYVFTVKRLSHSSERPCKRQLHFPAVCGDVSRTYLPFFFVLHISTSLVRNILERLISHFGFVNETTRFVSETVQLGQRISKPSITVISEEDHKIQTMPTIKVECPKCGNHLVSVWQVQTRGGDEASTQFMRCTKCSHTFREYT